jgi:hypothetical protein
MTKLLYVACVLLAISLAVNLWALAQVRSALRELPAVTIRAEVPPYSYSSTLVETNDSGYEIHPYWTTGATRTLTCEEW